MKVVNAQIAYILHKRAYRETSSILEVLTKDFGRLSLMSRGCRGARSKIAGNLMLFTPLVISWQGKGAMPYLKSIERANLKPPVLKNRALLSAMYINELLMYLLHKDDVHEDIFEHYHRCLYLLENVDNLEISLREFEVELLKMLGFGLDLNTEADTSSPIQVDEMYNYYFEHGMVKGTGNTKSNAPKISGACLMALRDKQYQEIAKSDDQLSELKQLMRAIIGYHLGSKKLKSRELFRPVGDKVM